MVNQPAKNGEVVPFGKYKDKPAEVLLADPEYCEWLLAQPWFRQRWPNVYNVVINYGAEPQDSPEHNEMQARFLDAEWCLQLAARVCPQLVRSRGFFHRSFEERGWDVVFEVIAPVDGHSNLASIRVELKPDLGDDYPTVLRQVLGYPKMPGGRRPVPCVVARRYGFEHVTWDQVRAVFAASKVRLLAESEIG